ncbi:hypothetical protein P4J09_25515 [Bacillus cereus]|nr:hypothetical protein [Bacillus cereus]
MNQCEYCAKEIVDGLLIEHTGDCFCNKDCLEIATGLTQEQTGAFYTVFE